MIKLFINLCVIYGHYIELFKKTKTKMNYNTYYVREKQFAP